ncbi:hypothetical protein ASPFODRAFT_220193 [Aspergillus luchuensis CBS 106.47]|uniref:Uncharacterized protein n=1 Tax=Aspergillus luchuensis (strain CBS 106.47) TaxID=1137211 RepID=A0A1M3TCD6_ASPLC|nr:hypothetical protein ASPFODRAFT_220193 [Aspergillus luchuensis CBS 106.47]
MDQILQSLHTPPWNLQDELRRVHQASRVHEAELSQLLCAAIGVGLAIMREFSKDVVHSPGVLSTPRIKSRVL